MSEQMNTGFSLPRELLEDRIKQHVSKNNEDYCIIVPLKEIVQTDDITLFTTGLLDAVIRNIPLRSASESRCPYAHATIEVYCVEPKGLFLSQTFALESKILAIVKCNSRLFSKHVAQGVASMPPAIIYGRTNEGQKVIGMYLPPLVEEYQHNGSSYSLLLDGTHRSVVCSSVGSSTLHVRIKKVSEPPPVDPIEWKELQFVNEKPKLENRYKNLRKELFRDLSYVGIDG